MTHQSNTNATKIAYQSLDTYKALQEINIKRKIAYKNLSVKRILQLALYAAKRRKKVGLQQDLWLENILMYQGYP